MTKDTSDLQDLWKSNEEETEMQMIQKTKDQLIGDRRLDRQLPQWDLIFVSAAALLVGICEFTGVLATGGMLTLGYLVIVAIAAVLALYARRKPDPVATMTPLELVKKAIEKAEDVLWSARSIYVAIPLGMVGGGAYAIFFLLDRDSIIQTSSIGLPLLLVLVVLAVAFFAGTVAFMLYGIRLARTKKAEIKELRLRLDRLNVA